MSGKGKDYVSFHILCEYGTIIQRKCMTGHQTTKKHNELMLKKMDRILQR